jgi:hypothetical protein
MTTVPTTPDAPDLPGVETTVGTPIPKIVQPKLLIPLTALDDIRMSIGYLNLRKVSRTITANEYTQVLGQIKVKLEKLKLDATYVGYYKFPECYIVEMGLHQVSMKDWLIDIISTNHIDPLIISKFGYTIETLTMDYNKYVKTTVATPVDITIQRKFIDDFQVARDYFNILDDLSMRFTITCLQELIRLTGLCYEDLTEPCLSKYAYTDKGLRFNVKLNYVQRPEVVNPAQTLDKTINTVNRWPFATDTQMPKALNVITNGTLNRRHYLGKDPELSNFLFDGSPLRCLGKFPHTCNKQTHFINGYETTLLPLTPEDIQFISKMGVVYVFGGTPTAPAMPPVTTGLPTENVRPQPTTVDVKTFRAISNKTLKTNFYLPKDTRINNFLIKGSPTITCVGKFPYQCDKEYKFRRDYENDLLPLEGFEIEDLWIRGVEYKYRDGIGGVTADNGQDQVLLQDPLYVGAPQPTGPPQRIPVINPTRRVTIRPDVLREKTIPIPTTTTPPLIAPTGRGHLIPIFVPLPAACLELQD